MQLELNTHPFSDELESIFVMLANSEMGMISNEKAKTINEFVGSMPEHKKEISFKNLRIFLLLLDRNKIYPVKLQYIKSWIVDYIEKKELSANDLCLLMKFYSESGFEVGGEFVEILVNNYIKSIQLRDTKSLSFSELARVYKSLLYFDLVGQGDFIGKLAKDEFIKFLLESHAKIGKSYICDNKELIFAHSFMRFINYFTYRFPDYLKRDGENISSLFKITESARISLDDHIKRQNIKSKIDKNCIKIIEKSLSNKGIDNVLFLDEYSSSILSCFDSRLSIKGIEVWLQFDPTWSHTVTQINATGDKILVESASTKINSLLSCVNKYNLIRFQDNELNDESLLLKKFYDSLKKFKREKIITIKKDALANKMVGTIRDSINDSLHYSNPYFLLANEDEAPKTELKAISNCAESDSGTAEMVIKTMPKKNRKKYKANIKDIETPLCPESELAQSAIDTNMPFIYNFNHFLGTQSFRIGALALSFGLVFCSASLVSQSSMLVATGCTIVVGSSFCCLKELMKKSYICNSYNPSEASISR
jgi:hypothetical protein